ncbi:MAG: hypothetical protein ACAI38_05225 [Myxococcota bacterium]|nr:hypothetical protein [Myxococcota bacterium]
MSGLITLPVGEVLPHGTLGVALGFDVAYKPLSLSLPSLSVPRGNIVKERVSLQAAFAWGLWGWLEIDGWLGMVAQQGGIDSSFTRTTLGFDNLGEPRLEDVSLGARVWATKRRGAVPAISIGGRVGLPIGAEGSFAGEPGLTVTPEVVASYSGGRTTWSSRFGYELRPNRVELGDATLGDRIRLGVGGAIGLDPSTYVQQRRSVIGEVHVSAWALGSHVPDRVFGVEATLAYRHRFSGAFGYAVAFGASGGIAPAYGVPLARVFLSIESVTKDPYRDSDEDTVPNRRDVCPGSEEDLDGFEDSDGCSDSDNDGDDIVDGDDECPMAAEDQPGPDADGCPMVIPDDRDLDTVPDDVDRCPDQDEDLDQYQDWDGCPEPDNDRDGLPDISDQCPLAPEDKNRVQDDDGCPDDGHGPQLISFKSRRLRLNRAITFEEGKAQLSKDSGRVLLQVAQLLRDHGEIEKVTIAVYPEKGGRRARKLAQDRANAIINELGVLGLTRDQVSGGAAHWDRKQAGSVTITAVIAPGKTR